MAPRAAVVTAIYDGYDTLKPVCRQDTGTDWVLVTDRPPPETLGWRVIHRPRAGLHPCRAAKHPKLFPWQYTSAPASVWVDATYAVTDPRFAETMLSRANPIAQFVHPHRDCLYEEAEHSAPLPKYAGEPIWQQAEAYAQAGHPKNWGLWCGGIIARIHTPEVLALGEAWAAEIAKWSFQDQISEPYALRNLGLRPSPLPGDYTCGPMFTFTPSDRHKQGGWE